MNELRLVVLKGIHKGSKLLIDPLVGTLSLSISLGVVSYRELEFCA